MYYWPGRGYYSRDNWRRTLSRVRSHKFQTDGQPIGAFDFLEQLTEINIEPTSDSDSEPTSDPESVHHGR